MSERVERASERASEARGLSERASETFEWDGEVECESLVGEGGSE